jgi:hypothetical protein
MHRPALALLAVAATLGASPALAFGEFAYGQWAGKAFFKSAEFTHCAMLSNQGSWKLAFEVGRQGAVKIGIFNKQLNFKKGDTMRVSLQLDSEPAEARTFVAAVPDLVVGSTGSSADLQKLLQGSKLKIHIGHLAANFSLSGLQEAFRQLSACTATRGANKNATGTPIQLFGRQKQSGSR